MSSILILSIPQEDLMSKYKITIIWMKLAGSLSVLSWYIYLKIPITDPVSEYITILC